MFFTDYYLEKFACFYGYTNTRSVFVIEDENWKRDCIRVKNLPSILF